MRLFLLIVLVITLVECGRRNRRRNRNNNEKTEKKDSKIPEDDEVEKEEKMEEKEPEEEKEDEEEDLDQDLSKLTCLFGYKNALQTKVTKCKTDLNSNCVMAYLPVNSEHSDIDMSTTLYGCSPQYSCEQLTRYMEDYEGSYCKTCDLKYDECNKDLQ